MEAGWGTNRGACRLDFFSGGMGHLQVFPRDREQPGAVRTRGNRRGHRGHTDWWLFFHNAHASMGNETDDHQSVRNPGAATYSYKCIHTAAPLTLFCASKFANFYIA